MLPKDALVRMRAQVAPTTDIEMVDLAQCHGRVLAEDVVAAIDLPPFANSAMDGYAIRSAEVAAGTTMTIAGKAFAGVPFEAECPAGQCVRIMTGALLPSGLDTIVMQENTSSDGDQVTFNFDCKHGQFVRGRGSELAAGTTVLTKGQRISPTEIGVLATVGVAQVKVYRQLTVALFSTGDELKAPGEPLQAGEIYDSNRHALRHMLEQMQVKVIDLGVISDDIDKVRAAFEQADALADVVVTSGGVSVGEADFIKIILDEMGQVNFWKLAIKPGKPFAFGSLPNSWFCGLPGNPVSSMVTCYELVQPLLSHLGGEAQKTPLLFNATLTTALKKGPGRQEYQRGVLTQAADGSLQVAATGAQSSDMTTSMSRANCFIVLPKEKQDPQAGETVTVEPFSAVLGGL
ncbi:molybdopterin molybdotransferase MoeA [uncultured Ferrimonas sp.]|uniref:molybdopterin molybdotransferase MoeA n=1 Tax=uncultured Ferrimonas sp. TaxID=432640 RepID=UPI002630FC52|nr:molybdopterin molybdotransferase MoeA [uncultured Ferrimonas sp.]